MSKKHALLAPPSVSKWLESPPIARLEEIATEEYGVESNSIYTEEGTVAHSLAEFKLRQFLGEKVIRPKSDFIDADIEAYTTDYLEFIKELIQDFK